MPDMRKALRHYGASPLHLLVLVGSFALAGYAALKLIADQPIAVVIWFVGAAVLHDLMLLPLYVLADRGARRRSLRHEHEHEHEHQHEDEDAALPAWVNYVRFPAAISAVLLLVFLPSIARLSGVYTATTGLSASPYLLHWLAITGVLFLISAVLYALRIRRRR
jgi:hypothetical protein